MRKAPREALVQRVGHSSLVNFVAFLGGRDLSLVAEKGKKFGFIENTSFVLMILEDITHKYIYSLIVSCHMPTLSASFIKESSCAPEMSGTSLLTADDKSSISIVPVLFLSIWLNNAVIFEP